MTDSKTTEQKPQEQETKPNPYFGRKCFRTERKD